MSLLRKSLLATACSFALAASASAITINESFDGAWVDPAAIGQNKGLMVDYIPAANTMFFAFFTYDGAGNPLWTVGAFQPQPGVATYTVPVERYAGGQFSAGGTPTGTAVGTVDLDISCTVIRMGFNPAQDSGLTAAAFDFQPSLGLDSLSTSECAAGLTAQQQCPTGTSADGADCRIQGSITGAVHLPAGKRYVIRGQVSVEENATLTIDPGVTVVGSTDRSSPNFLAVKRGGRIYAEGTPELPITFTGPEPVPGSWAGIVLNGRSICNDATAQQSCQFEAVPELLYGAVPPVLDDSSGALRYVRILWAGQQIAPNEELNSLTLNAVGSGTVLEHVQVDGGLDDGFEFFGGTVNGRYLVCSNMGDDCFDFDQGYSGRIQFALAWQGDNPDIGADSNGIESDNDNPASDKTPRTIPKISNMTLVGTGTVGNEGMRIRRGSGANFSNMVITGFRDRCVNLVDAQTYALASGSAQGAALSMTHSFVGGCLAGTFEDNANAPYAVSAWYNAGAGNSSGDPQLQPGGFLPAAGSPVLSGGRALSDPFFRPATYRGAFADPRDNWTKGWTVNLPGQ
jgi:hypothetical protein